MRRLRGCGMRSEVERYVVQCALCAPGHARYRVESRGGWPPMQLQVHRVLLQTCDEFANIADLLLPTDDGVEPWEYRAEMLFRWARHRLIEGGLLGVNGWDERALFAATFAESVDWQLFDRAVGALQDECA